MDKGVCNIGIGSMQFTCAHLNQVYAVYSAVTMNFVKIFFFVELISFLVRIYFLHYDAFNNEGSTNARLIQIISDLISLKQSLRFEIL